MSRRLPLFGAVFLLIGLMTACLSTDLTEKSGDLWSNPAKAIKRSHVLGFGFLFRIPGLWNGPVTSDTPAGDYPVWYVDFRPVSAAQISQFSIVDTSLCNYVTFFIVKHDGCLKVAMRTDARYEDEGCITYEVMQEADEGRGYYKFADFQSAEERAYTVFQFEENKFEMRVYTNKFNQLKEPVLHSCWKADRITMEPAGQAIREFNFPQPVMVKDFSAVFKNRHESIFFKLEEDPYPTKDEPYVGSVTFNITLDDKLKREPDHELFLMLTTKPIFEGFEYNPERLNYISKFVYLPIDVKNYTLTHVHPGTYYFYAYNDTNGDKKHESGDYMSSRMEHILHVPPGGNIKADTCIDYVIP